MMRPSKRYRTRIRTFNARGGESFCGTGETAAAVELAVPILLWDYYNEKSVKERVNLLGFINKHIKSRRSKDISVVG